MTSVVHSDTYPAISPLNLNLASRTVFITGASRGLGASIAVSYARAGASQIALGARSDLTSTVTSILEAARAANRPEPNVLPLQLDISNPRSVEKAAELVKSKFGRLDVVVNNAGVLNDMGHKIADSNPDEWWSNYEVNVKGPYLILRSFIPLLLATEDGLKTVSTVASVGALIATDGTSGYQASKWAVMKLADHAMSEYRDQGLVTFNVHPGNIHTTMLEGELPDILKPGKLFYLSRCFNAWNDANSVGSVY